MDFRYSVIVRTDTREHADLVITSRLDHDEEIQDEQGADFDYQIGEAGAFADVDETHSHKDDASDLYRGTHAHPFQETDNHVHAPDWRPK